MSDLQENALYQDLVMQRARAPLHGGVLEPADGHGEGRNAFCGDHVQVTLRWDEGACLGEVRHRTRGCAICTAAADLMAESVAGLDAESVRSLHRRFDAMLLRVEPESGAATASHQEAGLGVLRAFETLHEYRSRIRCATLPWDALLQAMGREGTQR